MTDRQFLIMAGGTGGHVFPALATARALQALGHKVHWLGSARGMESRLIADTDIPLSLIPVAGLRGKGLMTLVKAPFQLLKSLASARKVVRTVRPDCVVGMGGYVAGPGGLAARLNGIPLVIHEQNAVAGLTNRLLAPMARTVLEAFPGSFAKRPGVRCTGNPVRVEVCEVAAPEVRMAGREGSLRLLVVGGSLGAQVFNEILPEALARLPESSRPEVWHQCGQAKLDSARESYRQAGVEGRVDPFIADMAQAYGWADLVLCRAGALTVAELCAAGVGALLVPYPHAVDDHQTRNAGYMVEGGAAVLIPQPELTAEALADLLERFSADRQRLLEMAVAARDLAITDATERVVNYCLEAANA